MISPVQRRYRSTRRLAAGVRSDNSVVYIGSTRSAAVMMTVSAPSAAAAPSATSNAFSVVDPERVVPPTPRINGLDVDWSPVRVVAALRWMLDWVPDRLRSFA